jgi:glucokinase
VNEAVAKARVGGDDEAVAVLNWLSHGVASSAQD